MGLMEKGYSIQQIGMEQLDNHDKKLNKLTHTFTICKLTHNGS